MKNLELYSRIQGVQEEVNRFVESLPSEMRPKPCAGYGVVVVGTAPEVMAGWDYDWSDQGADPPPWSDWGDKEG